MSDEREVRAVGSGHGAAAVNIVLGSEALRPILWFFGTVTAVSLLVAILSLAIAAASRERAGDAYEAAARAQRQADLANWTMNNLEGLIQQHGVYIPEEFKPHNLTKGHGK